MSCYIQYVQIYKIFIVQIYIQYTLYKYIRYTWYTWIVTEVIIFFSCKKLKIHNLVQLPILKKGSTILIYVNLAFLILTIDIIFICLSHVISLSFHLPIPRRFSKKARRHIVNFEFNEWMLIINFSSHIVNTISTPSRKFKFIISLMLTYNLPCMMLTEYLTLMPRSFQWRPYFPVMNALATSERHCNKFIKQNRDHQS